MELRILGRNSFSIPQQVVLKEGSGPMESGFKRTPTYTNLVLLKNTKTRGE